MIQITIDEYINGYSVRVFDTKDGYIINEIHEEKLDALKAAGRYFKDEIIKDLERRQQNASM